MSRDYLSKWLYVGLHVKRWLVLLVIAIAIMGLGFSFIIREAYVTAYMATDVPEWVYYSTLWFLPRWARGLVLLAGATLLTVMAGWKLNKSLARALLPSADDREIIDVIYQHRTRGRGHPRQPVRSDSRRSPNPSLAQSDPSVAGTHRWVSPPVGPRG